MRRILISIYIAASVITTFTTSHAMADVLPLCERTPAVRDFIVNTINQQLGTTKTCQDITQEDLDSIKRVTVAGRNISQFKPDDFSGLYNLEILNIRSNPYKTLPIGLFRDLGNLKTLVIIATGLEEYPQDFLADTPFLENLHSFRNKATSMPYEVIERFGASDTFKAIDLDQQLDADVKTRLMTFFPVNGPVALSFF